jgi:hypothetical protein
MEGTDLVILEKIVLDNTRRSTFKSCKRKYYWNDVCGYKPDNGSSALRYGSTWHGMMEGYYRYIKENGWNDKALGIAKAVEFGKKKWDYLTDKQIFYPDYRTFEACAQSFVRYIDFYHEDSKILNVIDTERKYECPITLDTEEEKRLYSHLPPIVFTGRLDLQIEMNDMKWLVDFKTTGQGLALQGMRLNRSAQLLGYSYAGEKVLEFRPEGCMVSLHLLSARKSTKTGEYGNLTIDFLRVPQIFTAHDIKEWKRSYLDVANDLFLAFKHNSWPMNFDSCYQFGACAFTKLCEQNKPEGEISTEGYHIDHWDVLSEEEPS